MLFQSAPRVLGGVPNSVFAMVGERDANLKGVGKVLREALISARLMVEGRDAPGVTLVMSLGKVIFLATHLLGVKLDSAGLMVLWSRIKGFMVVQP